jgi:hypothetical protein
MHLPAPFLLVPTSTALITLSERAIKSKKKKKKRDPAAGESTVGRRARCRYMRENKKSKNISGLMLRHPVFLSLVSRETVAVTRVFGFRCSDRP